MTFEQQHEIVLRLQRARRLIRQGSRIEPVIEIDAVLLLITNPDFAASRGAV